MSAAAAVPLPQSGIRHDHSVDRAADFYECDPAAVADPDLGAQLAADIEQAGFNGVPIERPYIFYRFDGGGFSFLYMMMESHVSIHCSPENCHCHEITVHSCIIEGVENEKTAAQKTEDVFKLFRRRLNPQVIDNFPMRVRGGRYSELVRQASKS